MDDDHRGNQEPGTAMPIELGGDSADSVLDDLVVCSAAPSDFFELQAECAGYLSVEVRKLGARTPDLVLYSDGQAVEQLMGENQFFLRPMHRHVDAGVYVLEVRHSGGPPQQYRLTVVLLGESTCW